MAAPVFPPPITLRGATGRRFRGPLRGRFDSVAEHGNLAFASTEPTPEQLIRDTDKDASISRLSAVHTGYLVDRFAAEFVSDPNPPRRLPIINRGTYVRTRAIDKLVEAFINSNVGSPVQIISLGAGTDTRYWRLKEKGLHLNLLYHEIDYPSVSAAKVTAIRRSMVLSPVGTSFNVLNTTDPDLDPEMTMWGFFRDPPHHTQGYLFHPIDLRRPFQMQRLLDDVPTLLISECCLCYLSDLQADQVVKHFTSLINTIGIILYEPTNPFSTFGQTMTNNLAARGLYMPTVPVFPTLAAQVERLRHAGFTDAQTGADMLWLWKMWTPNTERLRLAGLELMDELEEWELLASHYSVVWAWRELPPGAGSFFEWVTDCDGVIPYPEELYWDEDEEEDGAEAKVDPMEDVE